MAATAAIGATGPAARALGTPAADASQLILLPDASPSADPYWLTQGAPLGYDSINPAPEASTIPGAVPANLSGRARDAYLLAHWKTLEGPALGEFAFRFMTARTLDPGYMGQEVPLLVFRALPVLDPRRFPDPTFKNFGFIPDPENPDGLPVGLETGGVRPRYVGMTCAACHAGLVGGNLVYGAPNSALRYGDFWLATTDVLSDPGLSFDRLVDAAQKAVGHPLSVGDKAEISRWLRHRPAEPALGDADRAEIATWGPGRLDLLTQTGFPTRIPALFGAQRPYMCDGTFASLRTADEYSLFARGLPDDALTTPVASRLLTAVAAYERHLVAPASPEFVDRGLVLRGARVFQQNCASCHFDRVNDVIPLEAVGTDDKRFRQVSALDLLSLGWSGLQGVQVRLWPMVKIPDLTGLWMRTELLHDGAVPTLEDLLEPADDRPPVFSQAGAAFDTSIPGNSNRGHEFGTQLEPADKAALLAYLRTL